MTGANAEPLGPRPDVTTDREDRRERSIVRARLFPDASEPEMIGRYRLRGRIGAGASGTVYEAVDDELAREVALKVVREHELARGGGRDRVWAEAKALARVNHPNVVAVYDVGWTGDDLYIAMELVRGESVDVWLAGDRAWREIVDVFGQAAAGLGAVHDQQLVHRDVKPANIRIGADGRVRVVDFGLAVEASGAAGAVEAAGTPGYMAPEQRRGEPVDGRSDQYGLGAALDHALRGRRAPRRIARVVARSVSPEPSERWPSMLAFRRALLDGARPGRWRYVALVALVAVAAGVALAVTITRTAPAAREQAHAVADHDPRLWREARWAAIAHPAGAYRASLDTQVHRTGTASGRVEARAGAAGEFGALAKTSPAEDYRGERVRMTAWIRTRGAVAGAGAWFRVDDRNGIDIAFDNMRDRQLIGDHDWTQVEIVLDVPDHGWNLVYGPSIQGAGTVWVDDVELEIVDGTTALTHSARDLPLELTDGSFDEPVSGWQLDTLSPGLYALGAADSAVHGEHCAHLQSTGSARPQDAGDVVQWIAAERYRGMQITVTAAVRGRGAAALVLASDGDGSGPPTVVAVEPTADWERHSIDRFVLPSASEIAVVARLSGRGELWIDDVRIEAVPVEDPPLPAIDAPVRGLGFEPSP